MLMLMLFLNLRPAELQHVALMMVPTFSNDVILRSFRKEVVDQRAVWGSAVYVEPAGCMTTGFAKVTKLRITFKNNHAVCGGAIYLQQVGEGFHTKGQRRTSSVRCRSRIVVR